MSGRLAGGKHQRVVVRSWWARVRPAIGRVVDDAVLVVGGVLRRTPGGGSPPGSSWRRAERRPFSDHLDVKGGRADVGQGRGRRAEERRRGFGRRGYLLPELVGLCIPAFGSGGLLVIHENRVPNPSLERVRKTAKW